VTGLMAALIGLATILTALALVWLISLRLRDASVADICSRVRPVISAGALPERYSNGAPA
jgi:steroid 5-alpha reductase family enzyme